MAGTPDTDHPAPVPPGAPLLDAIRTLLDAHKLPYRHLAHGPTHTSEESAAARGESTTIGGKTLLIKAGAGDRFVLVVISAARQMYSNRLRRALKVDRCRFATLEELKALTGLVPGSVPPFGAPILPFPLYVDDSVLANDRIAFNAGSLTDSIIMATADWRQAVTLEAVVQVARD